MTHNRILDLLTISCLSQKVILVCTRANDRKDSMNTSEEYLSLSSKSSIESFNDCGISDPMGKQSRQNLQDDLDPSKIIRAEIVKDVTGLGFIIEGGKNSSLGDRPIIIKRIFRGLLSLKSLEY